MWWLLLLLPGVWANFVPGVSFRYRGSLQSQPTRYQSFSHGLTVDPLSQDTVMVFALMNQNTYENPDSSEWNDIPGYEVERPIGYESSVRGYTFISEDNQTAILVIKGTSLTGPSSDQDQEMDNLMFSCCPECKLASYICSQSCLDQLFSNETTLSYVNLARVFYLELRSNYPKAEIWFSGHSLGGAVANVLGLQEHRPVLSFNAPGDQLYAQRLGFRPTGSSIYQYGNTGDPIFNGNCGRWCSTVGYYMESKCHLGYVCSYDLGGYWSLNYHRIDKMISSIIPYYPMPICTFQPCSDCETWSYP